MAVEADWPDAYRANQWARLLGHDRTAEEALGDFTRFPRWMWRNREVVLSLRAPEIASALAGPRLERAIGVLYLPDTEAVSHYFSARLPEQFDLIVHVDRTRAVEPLEKWARHEVDLPETYPTGV